MNPSIPDLEMPNVHVPPPYSPNVGNYDANGNKPSMMDGTGQFKSGSSRFNNHYDHGYGRRQGGSGYRQHSQRPNYYSGYGYDKPNYGRRVSSGNWRYDRDGSGSGYRQDDGYNINRYQQQSQSGYGYSRAKSYNYAANHGRGQMHRAPSSRPFPTNSTGGYKGTPRRVSGNGSYKDSSVSPRLGNDGDQRRSPVTRKNNNYDRGARHYSGTKRRSGSLYLLNGTFKETSFRELKDALMEKCTDCWIIKQWDSKILVRSSLPMEELLKNFEDFVFNGNKVEVTTAPKRESSSNMDERRRKSKGSSRTNFEIRMVDFKNGNIPNQDAVRNVLQSAGFEESKVIQTLNSGKMLKGALTCQVSKIDKNKFNGLKIGGGVVDKVSINKRSKVPVLALKVVPDYGLLKLSNLPNEFSTASLKKELKKCLNCELSIKSLKDGDAEVIFRPKVFDIEQLLANLTIDEKNVGVELVKETKTIDKVVKLPEKVDSSKFNDLLMELTPIEAFYGGKEFTLKFRVDEEKIKLVEEKVADLLPKPEPTRKESWAEEKEKDDEEKLEAPIMFGSTDIRERQKGVKRKQPSEAGNVRPTGESY